MARACSRAPVLLSGSPVSSCRVAEAGWPMEAGLGAPTAPYQEGLEEPEGAEEPDVEVRVQLRGRAVEGVGHHQERVGPHGEELPVVGAGRGDGLVGFEEARPRVPLVDDAVDVVVVACEPAAAVRDARQTSPSHGHSGHHPRNQAPSPGQAWPPLCTCCVPGFVPRRHEATSRIPPATLPAHGPHRRPSASPAADLPTSPARPGGGSLVG